MTAAVLFEHMEPPPERSRTPDLGRGHVYREAEGSPAQAVVHELGDLAVLDSPAYAPLRDPTDPPSGLRPVELAASVRAAGQLIAEGGDAGPGEALFALWFDVPADRCQEFDAWYVDEHGPLLLDVAGWRRWRLFEITRSNRAMTRLILHDLDAPGAMDRLRADRRWQTPALRALRSHEWFRDVSSHEYVRTA